MQISSKCYFAGILMIECHACSTVEYGVLLGSMN